MSLIGLREHGDPRWFYGLPREVQVDVLALWQAAETKGS